MGYELILFKRKCVNKEPPQCMGVEELIYWCNRFHEAGFATPYKDLTIEQRKRRKKFMEKTPENGSDGNLSFRINNNEFIITGSQLHSKKNLKRSDFVLVHSCKYEGDMCEVEYSGVVPPSSETMLHDLLYKKLPYVNAVFHGHDDIGLLIVDKLIKINISPDLLNGAVTKNVPKPGTRETPDAVLDAVGNDVKYIVILGHGFVSFGRNMEEAGKIALKNSERLRTQIKKLGILE
jgi:ribulose-5-phosphate 4-epimerase/fuculose-1-phosphate aldolase